MKKLTFLLILILSVSNLFSQTGDWRWVHPRPHGQYINNFKMIDANTWYALGDYGVMTKTTNAGANWTTFSIGYQSTLYPGAGIYTNLVSGWFFSANNFILGTTSSSGIVRSTNGGTAFDTVRVLNTGSGTVWGFHFINAQTGYLSGTSTYKVMKTTDAGTTWAQIPNLGALTFYDVYAADTNNIITASTSGNVYVTTNAGVNWSTSNVGTTSQLNDLNFINPSTGYVCGTSGLVRTTTNGGLNWSGTSTPTANTLYRLLISGAEIYAAGNMNPEVIYKSTDNCATWNPINAVAPGQNGALFAEGFDKNGSTMVIAGSYGQMNISTNNGANWSSVTYIVTAANMVDVYAASGNGRVVAIGSQTGLVGSAIYSTNGGTNWTATSYTAPNVLSDLNMINATTGYFVGRFGIFCKTTDGGATWDTTRSGHPSLVTYFCNGVDFINENTGWIVGGITGPGGSTKIFKTTNAGANWTEQTAAVAGPIGIKIDMLDANTGYFNGPTGPQKTTDGGTTWTLANTGLPVSSYNGLKVIDANNVFVSNSSAQIWGTSDGGASWVNLNFPITNIGTLFCTDWYDVNNGVVAGVFGTVGKTTNRGQSWQISYTGGYTTMGMDMIHPDTIFAVCGNSVGGQVFKFSRGVTGGITWNNETPAEYKLEQNYPNPFNPSTTIKFSIPKAGVVSLKIFDIAGREVKTLINSLGMNTGVITYDFDGSELASGIYFYSLVVDNNMIDTKKMVLVK